MSRAHYVSLDLHSRRDYMVRVKQLAELGLFKNHPGSKDEVLKFMEKHVHELKEISARSAVKIADLRKALPKTWEQRVKDMMFRREA